MQLYHTTTSEAAANIGCEGFRDGTGIYGATRERTGVWLANQPLSVNEGAKGFTLLVVELDLPDDEIACYELIEVGKPYREFCIPADMVNRSGRVRPVSYEEERELMRPHDEAVAAHMTAEQREHVPKIVQRIHEGYEQFPPEHQRELLDRVRAEEEAFERWNNPWV